MHAHRFSASLPSLLAVGTFLAAAAQACNTGDITLGENALTSDGGSGAQDGGSATDAACRPIPPIDPGACPGGLIHDQLDDHGCWLGYDCVPKNNDGGPAPDASNDAGGPCPTNRGQCVAVTPNGCPDGVYADPSVASCGGGVGVACCISCPQPVLPNCPPNAQATRSTKDQYGCVVGFECYETFTLLDADNGTTVTAKTHDDIVVTLTMNASTGYVWSVSQAGGLPAPIESTTPGSGPPGSDGTQTFYWQDLAAGSYAVTLIYKRPFETTPIKTFTFTANVSP